MGNPGRDPFGEPVRPALAPAHIVRKLAALGAYGVNLHDEDLVPRDARAAERDRIVREFKHVLAETGLVVPMATTNLFSDPAFKDGAFTSSDSRVRAYALQKTMTAIDLGVELGARHVRLLGRAGGRRDQRGRRPRTALAWYRDAINYLCEYVRSQGYDLRLALEAKPNEPRGDIFLPTTGHMLGLHRHTRAPRHASRSTPKSRTSGWPGWISRTPWRRRSWPRSCFTSTSTRSRRGASTRTCGSAVTT